MHLYTIIQTYSTHYHYFITFTKASAHWYFLEHVKINLYHNIIHVYTVLLLSLLLSELTIRKPMKRKKYFQFNKKGANQLVRSGCKRKLHKHNKLLEKENGNFDNNCAATHDVNSHQTTNSLGTV